MSLRIQKNIMIIGDMDEQTKAVSGLLTSAGCAVLHFESPEDGDLENFLK